MKKDKTIYRKNIGIIVFNQDKKVLWCQRVMDNNWQFPQGGVLDDENLRQAMYRELEEEVGLTKNNVKMIAKSKKWQYYDIPFTLSKKNSKYQGQRQKWFLLQLIESEKNINLTRDKNPEFNTYRWIDFALAKKEIIDFKKKVYKKIYKQFKPIISL